MAYADINQLRPTPRGLACAALINGLILTGIMFIAPNVIKELPIVGGPLIDISTPPPPADKQVPPPKAEHPTNKAQPQKQTPQVQASKGTSAEGGFVTPSFPPADLGQGPLIAELPPLLVIEPVFKAARLNPRFASALQPEYPPGMIREEKEGAVTIKILIGTDGRVKQVQPVRSDADAFLAATRKQALSSWRFLPATKDGEPVESWKEMTVRFQMPS
jgi:periplasmic protein TonB